MRKRVILFALLLALAVTFAMASAEEMTGKQIVEKMRDRATSTSGVMQVKMTIADKHGDKRVRTIISRMKDYPSGGKSVVTFVKPDDVKGTKFLIAEKEGDDDQFLYMPALKKVRRISSKQKSGSFMGTDFSYSDLQAYDPDKGVHKRLPDETVNGQACYKVETTPKEADDFEYSKIIYYVRQDNDVPVKGEFYDKRGDLLKVMTVEKLEKNESGDWVVRDSLMKNVQKDHSTRMEILQSKTNAKIDDDYFTERFLTDETKL
jgi:outer membrane lipoprotein-sorting protein